MSIAGRGWGLRALLLLAAVLVTTLAVAGAAPAATPRGTQDVGCPDGSGRVPGNFRFDGDHDAIQTFTPAKSGRIASAQALVLRQSGGTGGPITVNLNPVTDAGNPMSAVLSSATVPSSEVPVGTETTITANFDVENAPELLAGKKYALTLATTDTAANTWTVRDSDPCAGGNFFDEASGTGSWPRYDAVYRVYLGPENDDFAAARTVSGNDVSVGGTTAAATRESEEPDHYTTGDDNVWLGDHTAWYRWTAPASGTTTVDTCTSNIDSILAVYTGANLGGLTRVAENNNGCPSGWGSKVAFEAIAGETYRMAVGDAGGARENAFTLRISMPSYTAPANDNFAGARELSGSSATVFGTNFGATREAGDPPNIVVDPAAGHSVWYSWQAPESGPASVSLCDTDMHYGGADVYTGSSLGALSPVAVNYANCPSGGGIAANFEATKGTTYRFFVDGCCDKPQGTFTLFVGLRDTTPPTLKGFTPANREENVSPKANVTANFSEAMDKGSFDEISGHLSLARKGSSGAIPAGIYLNAAKTKVTLNPDRKLRPGATYVAKLRAGARDEAGNALTAGKTWRFTVKR